MTYLHRVLLRVLVLGRSTTWARPGARQLGLTSTDALVSTSLAGHVVATSSDFPASPVPVSWVALSDCDPKRPAASDRTDANTGPGCFSALLSFPRSPDVAERYASYKAWCAAHSLTNEAYVLAHTAWSGTRSNPRANVALAPNLAPYALEPGVEHWVLWHHPDDAPPTAELDARACRRAVCEVLRRGGAEVGPDRVITFQNPSEVRSVSGIAHAQVFIRVEGLSKLQRLLAEIRREHVQRSPWHSAASS